MKTTKLVRVAIWGIATVLVAAGFSILKLGETSATFADGTASTLKIWGAWIFGTSLFMLAANFVWGAARWAFQWSNEHWPAKKVIGKVIGGGFWRIIVFAPLLLLGLILGQNLGTTIRSNTLASIAKRDSSGLAALYADFTSEKISADDYINYLLTIARGDKLPEKYDRKGKSLGLQDIITAAAEHADDLSDETILEISKLLTLSSVSSSETAGQKTSLQESNENIFTAMLDAVLNTKDAHADTMDDLMQNDITTVLDEVILSRNGRFLIYYTKHGDNVISEEQARHIADILENIADNYSSILGLNFHYEPYTTGWGLELLDALLMDYNQTTSYISNQIVRLLDKNGIDREVRKTAMPIYLVDPIRNNGQNGFFTLAYYVNPSLSHYSRLFTKLVAYLSYINPDQFATLTIAPSVPDFPFMVIPPNNLKSGDIEQILAHELGHHYSIGLYAFPTTGDQDLSGVFISETLANWLSLQVTTQPKTDDPILSNHYAYHLEKGTSLDIRDATPVLHGYTPFPFLQDYSELVPDAQTKMFEALLHVDALEALRDKATPELFRKVFEQFSVRNITHDYQQQALTDVTTLPKGEEFDCDMAACAQSYDMNPASTQYLYFASTDYAGTKITIESSSDDVTISLLGKDAYDNWEILVQGEQTLSFELSRRPPYEIYAVALANTDIYNPQQFTVQTNLKLTGYENAGWVEIKDFRDGCQEVEPTALLQTGLEMTDSLAKLLHYNAIRFDDEEMNDLMQTQKALDGFTMRICDAELDPGIEMATAKRILREQMGISFEINNGNGSVMLVGFDPIRMIGRAYGLTQGTHTINLTSVRISR